MENFLLIDTLNQKQMQQLADLFKQVQWPRTQDEIEIMLTTSLSVGLVDAKTQKLIAYARVITDKIKHAFIFDVVVDELYRKKGIGKMIIQSIISHPQLARVTHFNLTSAPELLKFYQSLGFDERFVSLKEGSIQSLRLSKESKKAVSPS